MDNVIFNIWPDLSFEIIKYFVMMYVPFFFLVILIWFIVFFAIKILISRNRYRNYQRIYRQTVEQIKKQYIKNLQNLSSKDFIKQFINILENLILQNNYKNLDEILLYIWFPQQQVKEIKEFVYKGMWDEEIIAESIKNKISVLRDIF